MVMVVSLSHVDDGVINVLGNTCYGDASSMGELCTPEPIEEEVVLSEDDYDMPEFEVNQGKIEVVEGLPL